MQSEMERPVSSVSAPPQSFEGRLSRVRAWTLIPAFLGPPIAWAFIEQDRGISEYVSRQVNDALLYATLLAWWLVLAAPRPYSARASMGRPLNRAGFGLVMVALLGVSCLSIIWLLASYCRDLPRVASIGGTYIIELTGPDPSNLVALLFSVAVAPLVEELVFRATLFRGWRVRWSPVLALVVSSVLFGAIHSERVAAFLTGMTYTLLYTRTRSLWANVLAHSLNNAAMIALGALHYFWASPQIRLSGPVAYGAFALILLIGTGAWIHFVIKSWRTLGAPLPPDSVPVKSTVSSPLAPPEALRVGS
jgi:membrane protease YdiL (CAAX protease family)